MLTIHSLDRETDLLSPFVTPLTYEGLVDEMFTIKDGQIKVNSSILGSDEANADFNASTRYKSLHWLHNRSHMSTS